MSSNDINEELDDAVTERNLEKVKALLSAGADVNLIIQGDSLLHISRSAEISNELLLHGAHVDIRNMEGDTPLYYSIKRRREMPLIQTLLHHGADVNAVNHVRDTPLNCVLQYIDLLAASNFVRSKRVRCGSSRFRNTNSGPYLAYAKLLSKTDLLKNNDKDHVRKTSSEHVEFKDYVDSCLHEIRLMKADIVIDNWSLYDIMNKENIRTFRIKKTLTEKEILTNYPIYHDVISPKIRWYFERACLLNKLSELHVYAVSEVSNQKKEVILNFHCKSAIAEYLDNGDLLNLVAASDKYAALYPAGNTNDLSQRSALGLEQATAGSCIIHQNFQ